MTTADGRRVIAYGKTIAEARVKCEEKAGLTAKGIDVTATKQRLGQYLDWWLADIVTPKLAPKTVKAYRDTVRLHLAPELGSIELGKLTPQGVTSLLRKKERAGLSPRSVAMIREVLRGALNVAVKMQMVERNAAALAESPRQVKTERRMLSPDEAKRLLAVADQDRLAALYRLALTLGMRQAEILGLRWQDVDLDEGRLRVRQTLQRIGKVTVIKEPKTARSRRTLALSPSLVAALVARKDQQEFERKRAANLWQESGLVFTSSVGTPLIARNLTREFKRHLAAAGLPSTLRFYDMRHAAASLLIADGLPITAVSAMLGHALTSTTLNTYAHVLPGADRLTAEAMERLLG
jgi:integrase